MITLLSGGTGTPKLLQGLCRLLSQENLSIIVNTGEDLELSELHVSPDIDSVIYTLAGIINEEKWYGIRGDSFACHEMLERLGEPELLRIGDRDRAVKLYRTLLLGRGMKLSEAVKDTCSRFRIRANVMPMTDQKVQTMIKTSAGIQTFHEFWVVKKAEDRVEEVMFEHVESAEPAPGVTDAIKNADAVIIGPSNPVTSIGPILAVKQIRETIENHREKVLAISPIIGGFPVSGPADKLMKGIGLEVSPLGVAMLYRGVASSLMIDRRDAHLAPSIQALGFRVEPTNILMNDLASRVELARQVLKFAGFFSSLPKLL